VKVFALLIDLNQSGIVTVVFIIMIGVLLFIISLLFSSFTSIRTFHFGPKAVTHQQAFNHMPLPIWHGTLAEVWLQIA
jgi:hypothetical protein